MYCELLRVVDGADDAVIFCPLAHQGRAVALTKEISSLVGRKALRSPSYGGRVQICGAGIVGEALMEGMI